MEHRDNPDDVLTGPLPPELIARLARAMLWEEAEASVRLDRDSDVHTISLDDDGDTNGFPEPRP